MRLKLGRTLWIGSAAILVALSSVPALAQSGVAVSAGMDRSTVTINGVDSIWTTERVQFSWVRDEVGGWFGTVERQARFGMSDLVFSTSGYRRLGDWTIGGGGAVTAEPDFWFKHSVEGELSRRVTGSVVASAGYRVMAFLPTTVQQVMPALTWYHKRGELRGQLFATHNSARHAWSYSGLLLTSLSVAPRLRLFGAVARGDRIFDIASLPQGSARAWTANGSARIDLGHRLSLDIGGGISHEEPRFDQRTITVALRRSF
jgi:YaiO family outer membrane protein